MPEHYQSITDKKLIDSLKNGSVGLLPTDTVYGLVCIASNQASVERLYSLKNREKKPGTLIATNIEQLEAIGIKARYLKAVAHYWPAPISIVIPCVDLVVLHQGVGSIAVRIPRDINLNVLLQQTGPLLTTSANIPGQPPANTIREAEDYFGKDVDFYVDGGDLKGRQHSTIIRVVDDAVEVLRTGAVTIDQFGRLYDEPKKGKSSYKS